MRDDIYRCTGSRVQPYHLRTVKLECSIAHNPGNTNTACDCRRLSIDTTSVFSRFNAAVNAGKLESPVVLTNSTATLPAFRNSRGASHGYIRVDAQQPCLRAQDRPGHYGRPGQGDTLHPGSVPASEIGRPHSTR